MLSERSTRERERGERELEKLRKQPRSKGRGADRERGKRSRRIRRNLLVPAGPRQNRLSVHYFRVGAAVKEGERGERVVGIEGVRCGGEWGVWFDGKRVVQGVRATLFANRREPDTIENSLLRSSRSLTRDEERKKKGR